MDFMRRLIHEEEGQGIVEYALLIGLIALVAVVFLTASGTSISNIWGSITGKLQSTENDIP